MPHRALKVNICWYWYKQQKASAIFLLQATEYASLVLSPFRFHKSNEQTNRSGTHALTVRHSFLQSLWHNNWVRQFRSQDINREIKGNWRTIAMCKSQRFSNAFTGPFVAYTTHPSTKTSVQQTANLLWNIAYVKLWVHHSIPSYKHWNKRL